ncbi:MAG: polymorphic toxin type 24 domain-containing protein [Candidatus Tectimicrobiota bacterium]
MVPAPALEAQSKFTETVLAPAPPPFPAELPPPPIPPSVATAPLETAPPPSEVTPMEGIGTVPGFPAESPGSLESAPFPAVDNFQPAKPLLSESARNIDEVLREGHQIRGRFPQTAGSNEVLVRRDAAGRVTHYQLYDENGIPIQRVDVTGKAHGGIPTPHVLEFKRDVNPKTGEVFARPSRTVRQVRPEEIPN